MADEQRQKDPCPNCDDTGLVPEIVEWEIGDRSMGAYIVVPCPYCEKGRERKEKHERQKAQSKT